MGSDGAFRGRASEKSMLGRHGEPSRIFGLNPLNDLFQEIVGLRAHYQVLISEDERRYAIQPVLVRKVDIGGDLSSASASSHCHTFTSCCSSA